MLAVTVGPRFLYLSLLALVLSGCMYHDAQQLTGDRLVERSISVPPGNRGLLGSVKTELRSQGWSMRTGQGPSVTEATSPTRTESFDTSNTRYRLLVRDQQYDLCLDLDRAIDYEVLIIDARNGEEVLSVAGRGCQSRAVRNFREALQARR